jgi:hypothetical protein
MSEYKIEVLKKNYNLDLKPNRDFRIMENHWLPRKIGINYIAFGKTLYCSEQLDTMPDHEFLHIAQFNRYGTLRVLFHYLYYVTKNYLSSFDFGQSFVDVPFEREARYYEKVKSEMS